MFIAVLYVYCSDTFIAVLYMRLIAVLHIMLIAVLF